MTKKETKQPRDGNRKFASSKPIALYDKNGNVAYFTKEELAGFSKPKNPDCEPATKEYVKCLMRKYTKHQHEPNGDLSLMFLGTCIGWLITFALIIVKIFGGTPFYVSTTNTWLVPMFLFSVLCTVLHYELYYIITCSTTADLASHPELERYTPPACEKKDECD